MCPVHMEQSLSQSGEKTARSAMEGVVVTVGNSFGVIQCARVINARVLPDFFVEDDARSLPLGRLRSWGVSCLDGWIGSMRWVYEFCVSWSWSPLLTAEVPCLSFMCAV